MKCGIFRACFGLFAWARCGLNTGTSGLCFSPTSRMLRLVGSPGAILEGFAPWCVEKLVSYGVREDAAG
jgi:hypothetical protein